ncbi:hypothetical protein PSN45_002634 [Yamadazyma tenuis]|uniref:ER membrane protein complex subunit 4 n=1 Tax=Candida tenuis (strain ATCC 10573 / BCRC 21748 / CBS 615 / JCM 9827 / NBRC 10315 / NRRL Y-1498 / VKM Y-70) TaxID=590646 RepID=G3AZS2_CANTC|nr:uncharacterized protein CANTEDRAFT_112964 [Yamadazyma tenuis ATCC 10573]EGV65225.1 hypothetical protein CANTEDRAFT_112964 [Yamadazyma tenuis ATCC 10573]WEJ95122.1 hypothetical protein PSN45_002634 [Yamadazyma tenuis]
MLADDYPELLKPVVLQPSKSKESIKLPPGFSEKVSVKKNTVEVKQPPNLDELKNRKAWEMAVGPAKSIPMNLVMSYMTGNSLQMIPIMMTLMLFLNPLKAIFNDTNKMFKHLETEKNSAVILQAKLVFVVCQLACMSIGIWKLNSMGLIPKSDADWLSFKKPTTFAETIRLLS